jgi:hypothetical protein
MSFHFTKDDTNDDDLKTKCCSFSDGFDDLACHFFPDGCPIIPLVTQDEAKHLQIVWPRSNRRVTISSASALQAISRLFQYAKYTGCQNGSELVAIAIMASAALPNGPSTITHTSLRDSKLAVFCSLLRCMLPSLDLFRNMEDENIHQMIPIFHIITRRLVACLGSLSREQHQLDKKNNAVANAKNCLLRFMTLLALRWGPGVVHPHANVIVFQWSLQVPSTIDALRLIWYMASSTFPNKRNLSQLQVFLERLQEHNTSKSEKLNVSTIRNAVTTVLERHKHEALKTNSDQSFQDLQWLDFPELTWKRDFDKMDLRERQEEQPPEIDQESVGRVPSKLQKRSEHRCQDLILMLQRHLDSPIFDRQQRSIWWRFSSCSSASELLDAARLHYFAFSRKQYDEEAQKIGPSFEELEQYMRTILPFKLHEEWFHSGRRQSKSIGEEKRKNIDNMIPCPPQRNQGVVRLRLMIALSKFALQTGFLPLAAQEFIVSKIVPTSNSFMDSEMGTVFLSRVIPFVLLEGADDKSCIERAREKSCGHQKQFSMQFLLRHLKRYFLYGGSSSRYKIVTITLTPLFLNLGRLDSSHCRVFSHLHESNSITTRKLKAFIRWTEDLLLKGLLSSGDYNESLCAAAAYFYSALCCFLESQHENRNAAELQSTCMILPNSFLIYRMLLSASAIHIDQLCYILARYSKMMQRWKRSLTVLEEDRKSGNAFEIMQEKVFDCFLWDVFSTLWRNQPYLALNTSGTSGREMSILYTDIRPEVQETLLKSLKPHSLSITHGLAFAEYIFGFIQTHGEQFGISRPDQIAEKQKEKFLDYLQTCGLSGIYNFLVAFKDSNGTLKESESIDNHF